MIKTTAIATAAIAAPLIIQNPSAPPAPICSRSASSARRRGPGGPAGLNADKNVALTAIGDAFRTRSTAPSTLQASNGEKVKVTKGNPIRRLRCLSKVLDSGVDVVILTTPPGFRPMHLKAAVAAGKHIFCESPSPLMGPASAPFSKPSKNPKGKNSTSSPASAGAITTATATPSPSSTTAPSATSWPPTAATTPAACG